MSSHNAFAISSNVPFTGIGCNPIERSAGMRDMHVKNVDAIRVCFLFSISVLCGSIDAHLLVYLIAGTRFANPASKTGLARRRRNS